MEKKNLFFKKNKFFPDFFFELNKNGKLVFKGEDIKDCIFCNLYEPDFLNGKINREIIISLILNEDNKIVFFDKNCKKLKDNNILYLNLKEKLKIYLKNYNNNENISINNENILNEIFFNSLEIRKPYYCFENFSYEFSRGSFFLGKNSEESGRREKLYINFEKKNDKIFNYLFDGFLLFFDKEKYSSIKNEIEKYKNNKNYEYFMIREIVKKKEILEILNVEYKIKKFLIYEGDNIIFKFCDLDENEIKKFINYQSVENNEYYKKFIDLLKKFQQNNEGINIFQQQQQQQQLNEIGGYDKNKENSNFLKPLDVIEILTNIDREEDKDQKNNIFQQQQKQEQKSFNIKDLNFSSDSDENDEKQNINDKKIDEKIEQFQNIINSFISGLKNDPKNPEFIFKFNQIKNILK